MKKLFLVPLLFLVGCNQPIINSIPAVGEVCNVASGTLIDEKVIYAAAALYNVPAHAYVTAKNNGKLTPAIRDATRPMLIKMYSLYGTIKAAKGTVNCDYNSLLKLHGDVLALLPN